MPTYQKLTGVRYHNGTVLQLGTAVSGSFTSGQHATDRQEGFSDPDYKNKILLGSDASHAYKRFVHTIKQPMLTHSALHKADGLEHRAVSYTRGSLASIDVIPVRPATDDQALGVLKSKLATDLEQFKALVPLAELKETRGLIKSTADLTIALLQQLFDIKRGKLKNVHKRASQAWLQFSFAVAPTISDTNDLLNSIGSYLLRQDFKSRYTGTASEVWVEQWPGSYKATPTYVGGYWNQKHRQLFHNYKVQYVAGLSLGLSPSNNYGVSDHFGLNFRSLPSVLWEMLVFSWVADYFTTMGAFLEDAFEAPPGNTIYCTKSVKYTRNMEAPLEFVRDDIYKDYVHHYHTESPLLVSWDRLFERTVLTQLPHRGFHFKTHDQASKNSVARVLNLASVLLS